MGRGYWSKLKMGDQEKYKEVKNLGKLRARTWIQKIRDNDPDRYKEILKKNKERFRRKRYSCLVEYSQDPPSCVCCKEDMLEFLAIDHINNDGAKHRKMAGSFGGKTIVLWLIRNNFPKGFQVLCHNCNMGKRVNGGVCPHKTTD